MYGVSATASMWPKKLTESAGHMVQADFHGRGVRFESGKTDRRSTVISEWIIRGLRADGDGYYGGHRIDDYSRYQRSLLEMSAATNFRKGSRFQLANRRGTERKGEAKLQWTWTSQIVTGNSDPTSFSVKTIPRPNYTWYLPGATAFVFHPCITGNWPNLSNDLCHVVR